MVVGLLACTALGTTALPTTAQQSTNPTSQQGRKLPLRDQLRAGLKAFIKKDLVFIDKVVLLVEQGKLPRRLVDSTFLWARKRARFNPRHGRRQLRPMIYFQPALTLRAKRLGIQL